MSSSGVLDLDEGEKQGPATAPARDAVGQAVVTRLSGNQDSSLVPLAFRAMKYALGYPFLAPIHVQYGGYFGNCPDT